jgi:hypothetical protein
MPSTLTADSIVSLHCSQFPHTLNCEVAIGDAAFTESDVLSVSVVVDLFPQAALAIKTATKNMN